MTPSRYRLFETEYPYLLSGTAVAWLPVFAFPRCVEVVLESWRRLQTDRDIRIYGYVILENHLHWIASGPGLPERFEEFKSDTARRIIDEVGHAGLREMLQELHHFKLRHKVDQQHQLWQEGSPPQRIRDESTMRQKLDYLHYHPVRRGYVAEPEHWRYSSARDYAGLVGLMDVVTEWG